MWPVVIVVVLPLSQLLVEQMNVVGDAILVQELVELLVVDPVGPFDLPIQMWCSRANIDVADVERLQMPMKV